jgi:protein-S-isoprenylcysteine O-methyltransferase Ste14
MPGPVIMGYAVAVYLLFVSVLGYSVGFFAGAGAPKGIDQGPRAAWPAAVAIDVALLSLFAVQHTVMARPGFKRAWARVVPAPAERSTFVLAATLALALLFWLWRPIGGTAWKLPGPGAGTMTAGHLLFAVSATGYILAGIAFEEHDLIQDLGATYTAYRARVPALIPRLWPGHAAYLADPGSRGRRNR